VAHDLDRALLRLFRTRWHSPLAERSVLAYSRLGEHAALWYLIAAIGLALDREERATYRRTITTLAATQLLNSLIKLAVRRARPLLEDLPPLMPTVSTLAYPSAHASTSFAAARSLSRVLPSKPLHLAATAMALSRPYLGVHYPSDVAAGALLGTAAAEIAA